MCTHGGSRYGNDGCRRTYLSQRDLQAHINHRHLRLTSSSAVVDKEPQKISTVPLSHPTHQLGGSSRNLGSTQHIPVLNTRSNLVSVPIQDTPPPPPPPPPPPQQPATYFVSLASYKRKLVSWKIFLNLFLFLGFCGTSINGHSVQHFWSLSNATDDVPWGTELLRQFRCGRFCHVGRFSQFPAATS